MSVQQLSGPFLSVLGGPERLAPRDFRDRSLAIYQCRTAAVSRIFPYVRDWNGSEASDSALYGAACEIDPDLATLKCLGEAAERYSSCVALAGELEVTTANALGSAAFEWSRLPKLSCDELANPRQGLNPFQPGATMRWVPAIDAASCRTAYVPLILTHLYPRAWTSERFTYPISTGTALHPDPYRAIVSAILEVIERDALSVNWILRRPLRRIVIGAESRPLFDAATWELIRRDDILLYEATTEFGVPIIYARRYRPAHPRCVNIFGCACDPNILDALGKAAREAVMISHALEATTHRPPTDPMDCTLIIDGACMMMSPERTDAFDFLAEGGTVQLSALLDTRTSIPPEPTDQMRWLVTRLSEHDQRVYLTEISSDEVRDVGLRVFRAVLPGMMPLSFVHRSRFLASRRLADAHASMHPSASLADSINPWPQPFS